MNILLTISDFIIPVTILFIVVFGCLQKVDIYEVFLEGAKEGLQTVIDILPTLIGLVMAVEVVRAGGLLDLMVEWIRPFANVVGFPAELAPLSIVRLVSSSAATGLLTDLFAQYGPDSYLGRVASVMMSCTETVFYTMSLYFLSIGIRKTRWTLPCAILANLVGMIAAVWLVGVVF
ncbi:spore maturation protein [Anaerotignum sp.]|nr:spore maturation protein [Anaerotignum sp.]